MPTNTACVVVFSDDRQKILLQKREDFRVWGLPTGRVEAGETPEEAAIRETREETGYHVKLTRLVGRYWRPQMPNGGSLMHVYTGEVVGGNADEHGWEAVAVDWFHPDRLPRRTISFNLEIIADAQMETDTPVKKTQHFPAWQIALLRLGIALRNIRNRIIGRQ